MTRDPRKLTVAALALLPLRIFFGITFVYAGLDKLLDPTFLNPDSATSIQAQFQIFERVSPLSPLVHLAEPLAPILGVLIALGEIAVGLGALTGLCFRLAALGGAAMSFLFFLTASWATHPYYFGNDLPYALGWLTLALAGHGNLYVLSVARSDGPVTVAGRPLVSAPLLDRIVTRRNIIQVGGLAALTLAVGGLAGLIRFLRNEPQTRGPDIGDGPSPSPVGATATPGSSGSPAASTEPTAGPSTAPTAGPTAGPTAAPGIAIANVSQVKSAGARRFTVPITAPAPLPAGDPGIVIALADGSFVAYDATCTHEGCRVSYDRTSAVIFCPCHGAEFDPANHAAVLSGPAPTALLELPLVVNTQDGTIALAIS